MAFVTGNEGIIIKNFVLEFVNFLMNNKNLQSNLFQEDNFYHQFACSFSVL